MITSFTTFNYLNVNGLMDGLNVNGLNCKWITIFNHVYNIYINYINNIYI